MDNCLQSLQTTFNNLSLEEKLPFTQKALAILSNIEEEKNQSQQVMEEEPFLDDSSVDSNDPHLDISHSVLWKKCFEGMLPSSQTVRLFIFFLH